MFEMKVILLLLVFTTIAWAISLLNLTEDWNEYKVLFRKTYTSHEEESKRLKAYMKTKLKVEKHNLKYAKGDTSFTMETNKFADWFPEELKKIKGFKVHGWVRPRHRKVFKVAVGIRVPEEIDWVAEGAVTDVKDQGHCGSCYAFSAVGALEGLMYVTDGSVTDLSAQELVDCTTVIGNSGCDGGVISYCFEYVEKNQGISTSKSYPYTASEGLCKRSSGNAVASCTGFVDLEESEEELRRAVGTQAPVSIVFGASDEFMYYKRGIFDGKCGSEPNHAMLAVGYGKDKETGKDYWLVKNSWGVNWGEKGYARIIRGIGKCGIDKYNSYPSHGNSNIFRGQLGETYLILMVGVLVVTEFLN